MPRHLVRNLTHRASEEIKTEIYALTCSPYGGNNGQNPERSLSVSAFAKRSARFLAMADRDRREELREQQSLTAGIFGDPLPGMSALDRRRRNEGAD
jgi:hypothetical protein